MADNASVLFQTQYQQRVSAIYQQRGGRLRGMIASPARFNGSSEAKFYLAGKSSGYETTYAGQQNIPSGMGITPFTVPLRTFTVYEHIYEFDEDRMSIDEKEIVYDAGAMALGRLQDVEIMKAAYAKLDTLLGTGVVSTNCDFSAGAFSAVSAMTMCLQLQAQQVPWDGNVFCPLPQQAWNEFLLNKIVNSADHVDRDDLPFMKATDSRFWNGVNWFLYVEDSTQANQFYKEVDSGDDDTVMWHGTALGWAAHTDLSVKTQWHNEIDALSVNMKLKGNATTLQEGAGLVRARLRSTGTLALV